MEEDEDAAVTAAIDDTVEIRKLDIRLFNKLIVGTIYIR